MGYGGIAGVAGTYLVSGGDAELCLAAIVCAFWGYRKVVSLLGWDVCDVVEGDEG